MTTTIELAKKAGIFHVDMYDPDTFGKELEAFRALCVAERDRELMAMGMGPVELEYPEYHHQGMGCGLEDRGITDRYDACEYGFNEGVFRVFEQLPDDKCIYTADQLAAARLQGAEEERNKHCACQWDADDNRTYTCVRHQGWLDVIEEWSGRAKDAEKRIAELETQRDEYQKEADRLAAENKCFRDAAMQRVSEFAQLQEQLAECKADAERYRWLRDNAKEAPLNPRSFNSELCPDSRLRFDFPVLVSYNCIGSQISLNAAIDAARSGKGEV